MGLINLLRHHAFMAGWERLHRIALVGMNYWSSELDHTGEREALDWVAARVSKDRTAVLFDVGANVGYYSKAALLAFGSDCRIYAFEPSRATCDLARINLADDPQVDLICVALSDREGSAVLRVSEPGSSIASLEDLDRPVRPFDAALSETVAIATIDSFCAEKSIERIDFLKMDIEGHELSALRGARRMLAENRIDHLQFEFGENNVSSRTFLSDFVALLPGYDFFRVVPGGPVPWTYQGGRSEIFATMNYLAVRRSLSQPGGR